MIGRNGAFGVRACWELTRWLLLAVPLMAWGQTPLPQTAADSCRVRRVTSLPGSRQFASDFLEAMADDPDPKARDANVVWGLTADLSSKVPAQDRAMYISKSTDGGKTWTVVARIDSKYFDADIGEGERNGLGVVPGGREFVITTQLGAFQVLPRPGTTEPVVRSITGPRVPDTDPEVTIPKKKGEPVTAGVVKITADGRHMIVGYGYFDLEPQIVTYRKGRDGSWIEDKPLPQLPTEMDILSMEFGAWLAVCGNGRSGLPPENPRTAMDAALMEWGTTRRSRESAPWAARTWRPVGAFTTR